MNSRKTSSIFSGAAGIVIAFCALFGLCSCRTTADLLASFEQQIVTGDYEGAIRLCADRAGRNDRHQLLWQLNAASVCALGGHGSEAIAYADAAEKLAVENDFVGRIGRGTAVAGAVLTNDMATDYEARGPELVYNGLNKAIQYLLAGQRNACRTELNRTLGWQEEYGYRNRKYIAAVMDEIGKEQAKQNWPGGAGNAAVLAAMRGNEAISDKLPAGAFSADVGALAAADYVNTYALHVAGVFRWLNGDGGQVLRQARKFAPDNRVVQSDLADFEDGGRHAPPQGQVWIWFEDGLCPVRRELAQPIVVPVPVPHHRTELLAVTVAMPYLVKRPSGATSYAVNGVSAELLLDFDRLVERDFTIWLKGAVAREAARATIRLGTQIALLISEYNTDDHNVRLSLQLARLGTAVYSASVPAADIRSVTAMPRSVLVCRVALPADRILHIDIDGARSEVQLPGGSANAMVFVRKPAPSAPAAVACAAF